MRTALLSLSLLSLGLPLAACTGDPEAAYATRLRECGFATEGRLPDGGPFYAPDACYRACLAEASCDALRETYCGDSIEVLLACDARCAYVCDDGVLIGVERVCDGVTQCEGGEDEAGCPVFVCDGGEEIAARRRCDGWAQCLDGSDEEGCEGDEPTCGDGRTYPSYYRCDGWSYCSDGADEEGCARITIGC